MTKCIIHSLLLLLLPAALLAQDPQFSQYFHARMYLNPAFAGNTEVGRFTANYRNQWSMIPGGFNTFAASYDHNFYSANSGLAVLVTDDRAGSGGLKHTRISGMYSYQLQVSRKWAARFGVEGTYVDPSVNYRNLVFPDQIERGDDAFSLDVFRLNQRQYFDASGGFLVFTPSSWLGFSAHHINRPTNSFFNRDSNLPIKYSIHAGTNIPTVRASKSDVLQSVSFTVQYKAQAKFDQLDLGAYYHLKPLVAGLAYRGLPFKSYNQGLANVDAFIFYLGFQDNTYGIQFGYSYDLTISRLINETGGSHEVSITYELKSPKPRKRRTRSRILIPCAHF